MLGFSINWRRLADYLMNKRSCSEVSFYTGIDNGDVETANEFESLKNDGYTVKSKPIFAYKNKDKKISKRCVRCKEENVFIVDMGYKKKSNCDVELSIDAIEKSAPGVELMLFTGDGDFEYLIIKALEKGVERVYIFSYSGKDSKAGITISRFSTKLRNLIAVDTKRVFYTSLLDIKHAIKKELPTT